MKQPSQPGPSGISQTTNRNKQQASVEISTPVSRDEIIDNNIPSCSRKRTYEELFGDISDLLGNDISGIINSWIIMYLIMFLIL